MPFFSKRDTSYSQKEHSVRFIGMNGYSRMILYTNDVPNVIRITNHLEKWLCMYFIDDLNGSIIFKSGMDTQTILHEKTDV